MATVATLTRIVPFQWLPREAIDACSKHTEKKEEEVFQ